MRSGWGQLGRALSAGSAMLIVAACGGTSTPTAPSEAAVATKAVTTEAEATSISVTIRGSVVNASNRAVANANIECLGDVQCKGPYDVAEEGHEHVVATTDVNGRYEIVATSGSGGSSSFLMNANGAGYEQQWREVAWSDAACSSSQTGCAITVNFRLAPAAD